MQVMKKLVNLSGIIGFSMLVFFIIFGMYKIYIGLGDEPMGLFWKVYGITSASLILFYNIMSVILIYKERNGK